MSTKKTLFKPDTNLQSSCSAEDLQNICKRNKRPRHCEDGEKSEFSIFKDEMKTMITALFQDQHKRLEILEDHVKEIKLQNQDIQTTNQDIEKSMNFMCEQLQDMDINIKKLDQDSKSLNLEIENLNEKIEYLEKNGIKNFIEIRNVPKIKNETKKQLYDMFLTLAQNLGFSLSKNDLKDIMRAPSKKESKHSALLVEFQTSLTKSDMLISIRNFILNKNNPRLTASCLGQNGDSTPIYISELQSKNTKKIFYETKLFAKNFNFAHCWLSNGRVLLREEDGGPYLVIKNVKQLAELKTTLKK